MKPYLLPLGLVLTIVAITFSVRQIGAVGTGTQPMGKPMPEFELPLLKTPQIQKSNADLIGKVVLVNIWASWCLACRIEHPVLLNAGKQDSFTLVGLNYKDAPADALRWLDFYRDPYVFSLADVSGSTGDELGINTVPQTLLIDKEGIIRHRHIGPVSEIDISQKIMPIARQLAAEISGKG